MDKDSNYIKGSTIKDIDSIRASIFSQNTSTIKDSPISVRESTCLCWIAVGKTAIEIADILKISKHTVHFHTRNTIKKLDASNKTHAVTKGLVKGYISISEDIV